MKWQKKGLIYCPGAEIDWAKDSALTPTPILINDDTIRVYAGFRDELGISRIGFLDLDANNPSTIKYISKKPALSIGSPGEFDDNGMILGDVIKYNNQFYMYYIGFQIVQKVKFLAFTGLALSKDGINFSRYINTPIMDRGNNERYIKAIHSVLIEKNLWRIWYASGNGWEQIDGTPFPKYNIWYTESKDGINFDNKKILCIDLQGDEYRIGRPRVYKFRDKFIMLYTAGTTKGDYLPGYAESKDGMHWIRKDYEIGIELSKHGWDSRALCYPSLLSYKDKIYMFYNGNDMGKDGFGYAILEEW